MKINSKTFNEILFIKMEYKDVCLNYTMTKQNVHDMQLVNITSVHLTNLLINKLVDQLSPNIERYINEHKSELYDGATKIKDIINKFVDENK